MPVSSWTPSSIFPLFQTSYPGLRALLPPRPPHMLSHYPLHRPPFSAPQALSPQALGIHILFTWNVLSPAHQNDWLILNLKASAKLSDAFPYLSYLS